MRNAAHCFMRGVMIASCALFASSATAQTCIDPPPGLLGWWPGDGDSVDIHSGLHAVAVNGASYGPGMVGDAFDFNGFDGGQDDHVDLPPSALNGLGDLTIEMWVLSEGDQGAFLSGAGPTIPGVVTDNEILLLHGVGGGLAIVNQQRAGNIPDFWSDFGWHHFAFTRTGGVGAIFVDGVVVDVRPAATAAIAIGPGGLMLGQEQDCLGGCLEGHQALDGMIDELSIYDRALSEGEIFEIFAAGAAGKCKPPSRADLLREVDDLAFENAGLQSEVVDLESQLTGIDSEVEALLVRIADLEAAAEQAEQTSCDHAGKRRHDEHGHRGEWNRRNWKRQDWKRFEKRRRH